MRFFSVTFLSKAKQNLRSGPLFFGKGNQFCLDLKFQYVSPLKIHVSESVFLSLNKSRLAACEQSGELLASEAVSLRLFRVKAKWCIDENNR